MSLSRQVLIIIVLAFAVWAAIGLVRNEPVTISMLTPFGSVVTVVTLIATGFVKFAWKWPIFRGWLVQRPDLSGTWRCALSSSYKDPETNKPVDKVAYVVIRQTLTHLSMRLYTDTARSSSIAENLYLDSKDGLFALVLAYQSVPKVEQRKAASQIHYGCALYDHLDYESSVLEGQYWTDRGTSGSVRLSDRKWDAANSYETASALFDS